LVLCEVDFWEFATPVPSSKYTKVNTATYTAAMSSDYGYAPASKPLDGAYDPSKLTDTNNVKQLCIHTNADASPWWRAGLV